jgi:hypothetical protein
MRYNTILSSIAMTLTLVLLNVAPAVAQTTSGSLAGQVNDPQGAAVPNAKVSVTSVSRSETRTTQTDADGRFVFPQLQPDTYTLRVEAGGFKMYERSGVVLNANDKISVGDIALEVGSVAESVTITSAGEQLQTESGERGSAIVGDQIKNIAVNGRSYLSLTRLAPGVVNNNNYQVSGHAGLGGISANGARANQNNLTLDGIGNVDTGNNGDQLATVSIDAVAEFKILTSNYQAEYGRSSGAQISVVTKSGTNDFHGSGYLYHRHEGLNANNWLNNRDGRQRNLFRFNNFGYTIGGPVYLPRFGEGGPPYWSGRDKLFFFFAQEYQRQLRPQGVRNVTVPTALERQGNFSQSVDRDGRKVFIRDPLSGKPCSATDQSGCFPNNIIPQNRLYGPGLAILNSFPLPNVSGNNGFNFQSAISDSYPRREDMVRIDFKQSESLSIYGRYINNQDAITSFYGSFVLGANYPFVPIVDARPGKALAISATKTFNPTTINEVTVGFGKNQINIDPTTNGLTRAANGLSGLPMLFPSAIQRDFMPQFNFNGGRIANGPNFGTNNAPFFNFNRTIDIVDNFSKLLGKHAMKAGLYFQRSQKDQTSFANANGNINFIDNPSNPFDTGFGFANAALGVYQTFNQASQYATGRYRYTNLEFYVQDNWKATSKLTLDYGIRFYYIQPQYDQALQTSTFLPNLYDPSKAPLLYRPVLVGSARRAIDPRITSTPTLANTLPDFNIGRIVPGTGDLLNGIAKAGDKVSKYLQESPGILFAPRFGFAYDLTGTAKYVLRGGAGVFYDRYQGNETFDMLTNPPTTFSPTLQFGLLSDIRPITDINSIPIAPSGLNAFSFEGKIPTVYHFTLGLQTKLPYDFRLDVAYVGSQSRHLLQRVNINAVPYGATYRRENQDPTRYDGGVVPSVEPGLAAPYVQAGLSFSGTNALPQDFLRPYRGYGNINIHQMGGTSNYNSMQVALERRFAQNLFTQVSYTWSRAMGTTNGGDGDFNRIDQYQVLANYGPLNFDRPHNLVVNWIYQLPRLSRLAGDNKIVGFFGDNWQFSGIYNFQSGVPYTVGFSIPNIGNQQLTGSNTEGARIRLVGDRGPGNSRDPYRQLNAAAFAPPLPGSLGLESGRNYLYGPGINNFDLSLQKAFRFGESKQLELRVDAFNAFNHTQFGGGGTNGSGVNATLNVTSLTNPTPTNLPFDANGNFIPANRNGFGTVSGARDPRILQLVARFVF